MVRILSLLLALWGLFNTSLGIAQEYETVEVQHLTVASHATYEGQIEAVRNTPIAAQVAGVVQEIHVQAGQHVATGDKLLTIDANQALQQQQAVQAQLAATEAQLQALTSELQRQRALHQQQYLSKGAIERTEAEHKALTAQLLAQQAQLATAKSQTNFFTLRAPYDGVVVDVPATTGQLAMPGTALLSLFDPTALRATVSIPVAALPEPLIPAQVKVTLGSNELPFTDVQVLPTVHTSTHTVRLRLPLASTDNNLFPGQHVAISLSASQAPQRLYIPAKAVVQRAELTAVYVLSQQNRPILRQIRLGSAYDDNVEVLSGLNAGEHVLLDLPTRVK